MSNMLDYMTLEEVNTRLRKLPILAAVDHPSKKTKVIVRRGVTGYWDLDEIPDWATLNIDTDDAQLKAMQAGSIFGFHVQAADPDFWRQQQ